MSTLARPDGPMCRPAEIDVAAEPITGRAPRRTAARSMIRVVFIGHLVAFRDAGVRVEPRVCTATALREDIRQEPCLAGCPEENEGQPGGEDGGAALRR